MLVPFYRYYIAVLRYLYWFFMDSYDGKKVIDIIHVDNSNLHVSQNQEELYPVAGA
jgi:hypothetical protein